MGHARHAEHSQRQEGGNQASTVEVEKRRLLNPRAITNVATKLALLLSISACEPQKCEEGVHGNGSDWNGECIPSTETPEDTQTPTATEFPEETASPETTATPEPTATPINLPEKCTDGYGETVAYEDNDGDGYGSPDEGATILVCDNDEIPEGYADNDLDCNDDDESSYPGAEELLDEEDNDCDGTADNNSLVLEYTSFAAGYTKVEDSSGNGTDATIMGDPGYAYINGTDYLLFTDGTFALIDNPSELAINSGITVVANIVPKKDTGVLFYAETVSQDASYQVGIKKGEIVLTYNDLMLERAETFTYIDGMLQLNETNAIAISFDANSGNFPTMRMADETGTLNESNSVAMTNTNAMPYTTSEFTEASLAANPDGTYPYNGLLAGIQVDNQPTRDSSVLETYIQNILKQ